MNFLPIQFADSTSGIGSLGINGKAFIIQLITFALAYLVLRRWAFGPIIKMLNERREKIESGVSLTEQLQKEKIAFDKKADDALREARKQADTIISEAQETARAIAKENEEKVRAKADVIIAEAHERSEREFAQLRKQLEKEIVGLIADATEAIIDEKVDTKKDASLIERALKGQQA